MDSVGQEVGQGTGGWLAPQCWEHLLGLESSGGILTRVWCLGRADSAGHSSVACAGGWTPRVGVPRERLEGWQCQRPGDSCLSFKAQPRIRLAQ